MRSCRSLRKETSMVVACQQGPRYSARNHPSGVAVARPHALTHVATRIAHVAMLLIVRPGVMPGAVGAEPAAILKGWKVPRTADGHPDLQGNWTSATLTRLERPDEYGDR